MKKIAFIVSILFASSAFAGLLIEPQLGYILSGSSDFTASGVTYTSKYHGVDYGMRLGFQEFGIMGGLSYFHNSLSNDETATTTLVNTSASTKSKDDLIGVFIGVNAPILVRGWLAYNFSAKNSKTNAGTGSTTIGASGDWSKGSCTELGAGFTGLPFLSVNLIYRMYNFTSFYDSTHGTTNSGSVKPKELVLGLSIPLNI